MCLAKCEFVIGKIGNSEFAHSEFVVGDLVVRRVCHLSSLYIVSLYEYGFSEEDIIPTQTIPFLSTSQYVRGDMLCI